jgi:hypothetical protein
MGLECYSGCMSPSPPFRARSLPSPSCLGSPSTRNAHFPFFYLSLSLSQPLSHYEWNETMPYA